MNIHERREARLATEYRYNHSDKGKAASRRYYMSEKGKRSRRKGWKVWYRNHSVEIIAKKKKREQALRKECLEHYGGTPSKCACCGEDIFQFLVIDHIEGRGNAHRRKYTNGRAGTDFYRWLKKNKFPKGFQVLCHNCNNAKSNYGVCPHKEIS